MGIVWHNAQNARDHSRRHRFTSQPIPPSPPFCGGFLGNVSMPLHCPGNRSKGTPFLVMTFDCPTQFDASPAHEMTQLEKEECCGDEPGQGHRRLQTGTETRKA